MTFLYFLGILLVVQLPRVKPTHTSLKNVHFLLSGTTVVLVLQHCYDLDDGQEVTIVSQSQSRWPITITNNNHNLNLWVISI